MHSPSNTWWIGPLVLTMLRLLYTEARLTHAKTKDGSLVFSGVVAMRGIFGCGVVGFSILIVREVGREETWVLALAAVFVIATCFCWPATITVQPDGVRRYLWFRRVVFIPWTEVAGIEKNKGGDIIVFSKMAQSITFTRFHTDPRRFEMEVRSRAKLGQTIRADAMPTIR